MRVMEIRRLHGQLHLNSESPLMDEVVHARMGTAASRFSPSFVRPER